jgi:cyanophycin synthetase
VVDYAHNPPAVEALGEFVRGVNVRGRRIGVIGAPGDRRDVDNIRFAQICAGTFDMTVIREDWDRRGRASGEVATLLHKTILEQGKPTEVCQIIENEFDAIRFVLDMAEAGDLVVILADDIPGAWKLVTKYAQPDTYRRWLAETGQPVPPDDQPIGWRGLK